MPEVGIPELLIILIIALIIFGPSRLSGAGAALGQAIRDFRRGVQGQQPEPAPDEADENEA